MREKGPHEAAPLLFLQGFPTQSLDWWKVASAFADRHCFDFAGRRDARPDWFSADLIALAALAADGRIAPAIAARFPLEHARKAHDILGKGEVRGKIILDAEP